MKKVYPISIFSYFSRLRFTNLIFSSSVILIGLEYEQKKETMFCLLFGQIYQ